MSFECGLRFRQIYSDTFSRLVAKRVPTRLQYQTTECGVAALAMILAHHGRYVPMEDVRQMTGVSRDCLNAGDLVRAGRQYGLETKAYRREPDSLRNMSFPFVAHLSFIHFVVVEGMTSDMVLVNDPAVGRGEIPIEKFNEIYTGIVITFQPGEDFQTGGKDETPFCSLWQRIGRWSKTLLAISTALSLVVALPLIVLAAEFGDLMLRATMEPSGLVAPHTIGIMTLMVGLYLLLRALLSHCYASMHSRMAIDQAKSTLSGLRASTYAYINYRLPSELSKTVYDNDQIARLVCHDLLPAFLTLPPTVILLFALGAIDPTIGLAIFVLTTFYGIGLAVTFQWRSGDHRRYRQHADNDFQHLTSSLETIETAKVAGMDNDFVCGGIGSHAAQNEYYQNVLVSRSGAQVLTKMIKWAFLGATAILSAVAVISGRLGIDDMMSLYLLSGALALTVRNWAVAHGKLDALHHLLLRQEDIAERPSTRFPATTPHPNGDTSGPPDRSFHMRSVVFGHSRSRPALLSGVDFDLSPGEQVGITGPSGGGKSTFGGLAAGLHQPWSGTVWTGFTPDDDGLSCPVVWIDKSPFLFEGTVRENLCLWQNDISEDDLRRAVRDACMDDVLAARPDGLDAMITARGRNFSGGQRQRLEIARALLRNPTILILDEALDALNPSLETRLRNTFRRRGCGVLIISHRASTLASCDRVLHLINGKLSASPPDYPASSANAASSSTPVESINETESHADLTDGAKLEKTFQALCEKIGCRSLEVGLCGPTPIKKGVFALARASGLYQRRIKYVIRDWWRRSHSPLLGFARKSFEPLLLEPTAQGGFKPTSGDELENDAYSLYSPPDLNDKSIISLFRRSLTFACEDIVRTVTLSLMLSALIIAVPAAVYGLLGDTPLPLSRGIQTRLGFSFIAVLGIAGLLYSAREITVLRIEGFLESAVMEQLYQRLIRFRPKFIRSKAPEELSRALATIPRLFDYLREGTVQKIGDGLFVVSGLILLTAVNAWIGLLALVLFIPAIVVPPAIEATGLAVHKKYFQERVTARRFLFDMFRGIARLRSFGVEEHAATQWVEGYVREKHLERRINAVASARTLFEDTYMWFALMTTVAALASGLGATSMSTWQVAVVFLGFWPALTGALGLGAATAAIVHVSVFVPDLQDLIAAPHEPKGGIALAGAVLEADQISFSYEGTTMLALSEVSLRIEPGEMVAIAGPSGGGKSTLLRLLLGFEQPQQGVISIGGVGADELDMLAWRVSVGVVQQDDRIESAGTLRSQVCGIAPNGVDDAWRAVEQAALADDVLAMPMGIQTIVERDKISTGQEQRLLIAKQLLRKPSTLILDEATNAIPEDRQSQIFANIREQRTTCILVTHRESAIAAADRVLMVEGGRITWSGSPTDFFAQNRLSEIVRKERHVEEEGRYD